MADVTPKSEGRKGARKHSGLGRGLGALIPQAGEQKSPAAPVAPARPLDVFFPEGPSAKGRGGSAKDLCSPSDPRPRRKRSARPCPVWTQPAAVVRASLPSLLVLGSMAQLPARAAHPPASLPRWPHPPLRLRRMFT